VPKTIPMRSARRKSQARKASAPSSTARPPEQVQVPFFLDHGRAWINGNEVGGVDPRYAHLDRSYD
jgi:hypothetical protein